jgi:RHS repeat-associated protein
MHDTISRSPVSLSNWLTALNQRREQITSTVYDLAYPGFTAVLDDRQIIRQRNLRNRVSYTTYTDGWNIANFNQGSFYTYDIHGNVDTLLQDYGCGSCSAAEVFNLMNQNGNRFKKISYNYDLISGKVNSVAYQKGWSDQFFHRYSYDGENRLTLVETSLDGFNWDKDARYEYYLHGPLARTVLGSQQVQGLDYAYTLQGWLKGVNSAGATEAFDMSGDGRLTSGNRYVARDAFGFALNYYGNDYKAILNNESLHPFPGYSSYLDADFRSLYNGNISSMVSTNRLFEKPAGQTDTATLLFNYQYDQLNRITGMDAWSQFNRSSNSFAGLSKLAHYREKVAYDPNGNILKYVRHGNGPQTLMDSLTYEYYAGTNKLRRVRDSVFDASRYGANAWDKIVDIDDQVDVENYVYDSIGNLIRDKAEKITNINWNVYGKITGISRGAGTQVPASEIRYSYDAAGNRISKIVEKNNQKSITWYVRDAQGNVMATYTSESASSTPLQGFEIKESERYLYGSSRLGVVTTVQPVDNGNAGPAAVVDTGGIFLRGERMYELSNHLGNVLVTISDRKKGIADPLNAALIKFFEPVMLSGTDYYPFGMAMRVGGESKYKYGYNGQEMSNEVKGEGNSYTAEFWEYDPRIGRRWNLDPRPMVGVSEYSAFNNNPILNSDPLGDTTKPWFPRHDVKSAGDLTYIPYNFITGLANSVQSIGNAVVDLGNSPDKIQHLNSKISMSFNNTMKYLVHDPYKYYRETPNDQILSDTKSFFTNLDNYAKAFEATATGYLIGRPLAESQVVKNFTLRNKTEGGLFRRDANLGGFTSLEVPMQLRTVKRLAQEGGIGLTGVTLKINRDLDLMGRGLFGRALNKTITLYPDAFQNTETLIKTLGHERTHIYQFKIFGKIHDTKMSGTFEEAARQAEDFFYDYYKKNKK